MRRVIVTLGFHLTLYQIPGLEKEGQHHYPYLVDLVPFNWDPVHQGPSYYSS